MARNDIQANIAVSIHEIFEFQSALLCSVGKREEPNQDQEQTGSGQNQDHENREELNKKQKRIKISNSNKSLAKAESGSRPESSCGTQAEAFVGL